MFSDVLNSSSFPVVALLIVSTVLAYAVVLGIYRLFFHPLSRFPGPKLAAVTQLYELYYDAVQGRQFFREIERMHAIYGPIVRINPSEIHVNDPDFYSTLYANKNHARDKYYTILSPTSVFSTIPHKLHVLRRMALEPIFSKQSIIQFEPLIREKLDVLCKTIESKSKTSGIFEFHSVYLALTTDIITQALFGKSGCWDCLLRPRFAAEWQEAILGTSEYSTLVRHMYSLVDLIKYVPYQYVLKANKKLGFFVKSLNSIEDSVNQYIRGELNGTNSEERTILSQIYTSDLPKDERNFDRMCDEGTTIATGGMEPVPHLLRDLSYHLLANPSILARLRQELDDVMPKPDSPITWMQLEALPYFRAVMQEALRISAIVTSRLPRIAPDETLCYREYTIPPGTPTSMTIHLLSLNPTTFPEPLKFDPDRWTEDDTPNTTKGDRKYVVPFSTGDRDCAGKHLATAQAYLVIATLFRRYEFELYKTSRDDIRTARDCFTGQSRKGSKGVRVKVIGLRK